MWFDDRIGQERREDEEKEHMNMMISFETMDRILMFVK